MLGLVSSNIVVVGVVAGIPALSVLLVVLWSRPGRTAVAGVATVIAVTLIGVCVWAVFRPSGQQAVASVSIGPLPSSTVSAPQPPPPACSGSGSTSLQETASGLVFSPSCLAAPPGKAFTIAFDNKDSGIPHNMHIFSADPSADPSAQSLFAGDLVTGPATVDYQVPAIPPGTYFFHCDVHPTQMKGTLKVG
jgi:plastocyanin